ncbi:DnaD domain protein [Tepidibacillus infernus]|uniref:Uncharacterized protein n=1 Tax=Tepidibacillus decaturensis TaxID=1413211 RepID=A0A135L1L4_9BACI|nr:DnaD domain protein [Tepidibacillus decaturensis]KXG42846.1 hypothetical protein U473_01480 [Tepidibacillus decaturensis]
MSYIFNEITPQDSYIIRLPNSIETTQFSYMIELYQPIIGTEALSLYLTFIYHLPLGQAGVSIPNLHRGLMTQLQLSFPTIIKARKVLEAVGLLETIKYKHVEKNEHIFEYTLFPPLHPIQFFQSDVLSLLLLNRLGKSAFQTLKSKLTPNLNWNHGYYIFAEKITKSFDEVFDTVLASEFKIKPGSEIEQLIQPLEYQEEKKQSPKLDIKKKYLDIDFIKGMGSSIYPLEKIIDSDLEKLLHELAFLYQLSETDMINLLKDHTIYDSTGKIDKQSLRKRVKERVQFAEKEVVIVQKEQLVDEKKQKSAHNLSKAEQHQWELEHLTPIELMKQYQGGGKIAEADLNLIEGLLIDYQLPSGVVNVLIEYIMLTNEYKLPKNLTEKIAGHWKRLKIKTVNEAQNVAKKEHQLYKEWKEVKKGSKNAAKKAFTSTKSGKKEKIPDYILQQEEKYHQKENTTDSIDKESQDEINQLLRKLGEI